MPSRLQTNEPFALKVKVLGETREIPCAGNWNDVKPRPRGPFNRNVQRGIRYVDNVLPAWTGRLTLSGNGIEGPSELVFDGVRQGAFPGDKRPICTFSGFRWTVPGFRFLRLTDPESGAEGCSNAAYVSDAQPRLRMYWGDPHWQTFFSDGIRCPEELYAFARDEAFLDFGAISDHMESVTDRQWDYFRAVTNDFNAPDRFATLVGQEWTHHDPHTGAPGHRNVYYRGADGPVLRSTDPRCDTLGKLWARLDALRGIEALAIPHHSANLVMGVDWSQGWNAKYEKAVEIYSVWGSSERPAADGNSRPIPRENLGGELAGRHVVDALRRGYRLGFVGGGDIHDGRPGEALQADSYPAMPYRPYPQGLTAVLAPRLMRETVFDAVRDGQTYATTARRIYLETSPGNGQMLVRTAAEDGLVRAVLMRNGKEAAVLEPDNDVRVLEGRFDTGLNGHSDCAYVRVETLSGDLAWSSPVWGPSGRTR